jgi:hypothetical protein
VTTCVSVGLTEPCDGLMVKPETVIGWHRQGFRLYWRWKSRHGDGRPAVSLEVRNLIRQMSDANPRWGAPRIHGELLKIGIEDWNRSVSSGRGQIQVRHRKPPSQTWQTFLRNHTKDFVSIDFFVVPTITFQLLFTFVILSHDRRRLVHFAVTANPTAEWTARQPPDNFCKHFLGTLRRGICCPIATARTGWNSARWRNAWAFTKS